MKSSTRLDSAVFQLTPTRTRCDLLVTANGKTEKIASGLVKPFLAHLKTAQDQVDKGGYSIILKPEAGDDATWFTKRTIARFVRFVSTPEVLERVYTIETEIVQIKEAIGIQNNSDMALTVVEDKLQVKKAESMEGSRPLLESSEEKAIVLYQPGSHPQQANGSTVPEENSKAQVLKVLKTRKKVLQNEQGMAFACAVAAGFDIDDMAPLLSFAKNFGASRLMDACVKFMELWKKKHETGQWVDIAATEAMYVQPDVSAVNDSEIVLANTAITRRDSLPDTPENNDGKSPADNKPNGHQEYLQGQLPQPMYSPWPVQSPPGAFPVFQGYPMQGMPYYPSYPGSSPYPSPYPSSDDPRYSSDRRKARKHHSSDSEDSESEDSDKEKARSGRRRKSGKVVIRNINYISSKKQNNDAESQDEGATREHLNGEERATEGAEGDSGHWQAFQTFLLQEADKNEHKIDHMMEKEVVGKRRQRAGEYDPLIYDERDVEQYQEGNIADMQNGNATRRDKGSSDESFISRKHGSGDSRVYGQMDAQYIEVDGKRVLSRRNGTDDFMNCRRQHGLGRSSDLLTLNGFDNPRNGLDRSSYNVDDDSYIVPLRSSGLDATGGNKRNAIDIGSEFSSSHPTDENEGKQGKYEPHDLSLMPERGTEKLSTGYDPALDFGSETRVNKKKAAAGGAKKSAKDPKSRVPTDTADKRKASGPIRKGRTTKMSPLDEARARAEKLRSFKTDLQKMKKEKEEEERMRIEALKIARQKRIAARNNTVAGEAQLPSQQTRKPLQNKVSSGTHRGSKFSDSEPGSSSPFQRFPIRTASLTSTDYQKLSKNGKLSTRSNSTGNRLTRSVSSLPLSKKDSKTAPDIKSSVSRTRRLSEPKMRSSGSNPSVRSRGSITSKRMPNAPGSKNISAIVNHDKTKIASLPELKIKALSGPTTSSVKMGKVTENRSSAEVAPRGDKEKSVCHKENDESPVIEKTVVMLECEKSSASALPVSAQNISSDPEHLKKLDTRKKPEAVSEWVEGIFPASIPSVGIDKEPMEATHDNANANDIVLVRLENLSDMVTETPKFPTSQSIAGKPYEAPYARVSSLEDPSTGNYSWAPPTSIPINGTEQETVKVLVPESKTAMLEKITEASSDKAQMKESTSKGLRKLLKFGRKTNNSMDSDNVAVNNEPAINTSTSSEAFTLKNLISQDETPTAAAAGSQKSSRHFSLLSPFKNKTK
ncbi:PREDICTED: uncharacterized protein LOC104801554 [Tarenaya hassleriana]|uniref:uncharacterized protein LOC104801554 n=1 Tax=Tarenaya hassleriana TaxID=28532 RepID=UPI00053C7F34|nr:PREDICTED: uncharacterized protein LOC104801554 [Tarenaya hassleriana]